jgi:hypothetical protein
MTTLIGELALKYKEIIASEKIFTDTSLLLVQICFAQT